MFICSSDVHLPNSFACIPHNESKHLPPRRCFALYIPCVIRYPLTGANEMLIARFALRQNICRRFLHIFDKESHFLYLLPQIHGYTPFILGKAMVAERKSGFLREISVLSGENHKRREWK